MSELRKRNGPASNEAQARPISSEADIDEALAELDRITHHFAGGMSDLDAMLGPAGSDLPDSTQELVIGGAEAEPAQTERSMSEVEPPDAAGRLEQRMKVVEQEARNYLDQAKARADKLVQSMLGAVEQEAARMREEAEAKINGRWLTAEGEATEHLAEAERVANGIVAARRQTIAELSDEVVANGGALTAGMADALRVQEQFEGYVRTLAKTADRIAEDYFPSPPKLRSVAAAERHEREAEAGGGFAA